MGGPIRPTERTPDDAAAPGPGPAAPEPAPVAVPVDERVEAPFGLRLPQRYRVVELLGAGGMGEVFRALDRLSGQHIALKRVVSTVRGARGADATEDGIDDEPPTHTVALPSDAAPQTVAVLSYSASPEVVLRQHRVAIANEFKTLASLRHPHIISVLDYGFDEEGSPFFTMELLPTPQPFTLAAANRPVAEVVTLAGQLLAALAYLHRHGILHRDLKPSNVLCIGDRVKVLDFGVATHRSSARDVAGTLEYMAPELLLGSPPSPASDLYAVGVLLWEALIGRYPFARDSPTSFLKDVLGARGRDTLPEHIRPLLSRPQWGSAQPVPTADDAGTQRESALASTRAREDGADRAAPPPPLLDLSQIPDVLHEVLQRLLHRDPQHRFQSAEEVVSALSRQTGVLLSGTLASSRESLLSAAPLVGRDTEVARLRTLLAQAKAGQGSLLLLAGESGVGKSRLIDELRTMALVEGAQVVRAQSVNAGGSPLQELAEALRPLSLCVELQDDSAAVLKELVPDLPVLLGRAVPDAPVLDSQAAQQRLLAVIESVLLRVETPTVLLLEDVHWAARETITLLQRLQPQLAARPILAVASYRDDERPELPQELPGGQLLRVRRLEAEAVAALATAVLGRDGQDPELVRHLMRESEGNALFLIEVTRALAEEAGAGSGSGVAGARLQALPVGIRALLQRRLRRVPALHYASLQLTAVAGRQVDLLLLGELCPDGEAFLASCADAGVLEVHEERWRFSHDKLREVLLGELSPHETRQLHRTVAGALERLYGDGALHAAALAYHFDHGGVPERAVHHGLHAGEHALRRGALVEASQILRRTTELLPQGDATPLQIAQTHRLLAQALAGLGQIAACTAACQVGLKALGRPLPQRTPGLLVGLVREAAGQVQRLLSGPGALPSNLFGPSDDTDDRSARAEEAELLALVGEASFYSLQQLQMIYCMVGSTNAADDVSAVERQVFGYSSLALVLSLTPLRRGAAAYFARAEALLRRSQKPDPRAELGLRRVRALVYVSAGQLRAALHESDLAVAGAARLRDDPLRMFCLLVRRMARLHLGDFPGLLRDGEEIERLARAGHNVQQLTWALAINALVRLRMGELDRAERELGDASAHASASQDRVARNAVDALRAQLFLLRGEPLRSRELLGPAIAMLIRTKLTMPGILVCFRVLLEVGRATLARTPDPSLAASQEKLVQRLERYARANPIARPAAALWQGLLLRDRGRPQRALGPLRRALAQAQRMEMQYDEAEAHEAIGRLRLDPSPAGAPLLLTTRAAREYIARARDLYLRMGLIKRAESLP
ncbi:MAG: AAA family ATPase [Polyangia bacterium]